MQVQIVTAATRHGALEEARRRLGSDPLVLSVRRRRSAAGGPAWEAVVAREGAEEPRVEPAPTWSAVPAPSPQDAHAQYEALREDLVQLRGQLARGSAARADVIALAHRLSALESELRSAVLSGREISPRWMPLVRRLEESGFAKEDGLQIIEALAARFPGEAIPPSEYRSELRHLLSNGVEVAPATERVRPGLVVFVGAAGVGKTTLAAKLAADLRLGGSAAPALGILRPRPGLGTEALRRCAHTLGVEMVEANDASGLAELWERSTRQPVILDSASLNPRSEPAVESLASLLARTPDAEVHAVVPASHGLDDFTRTLSAFSCFPRVRLSVTRLDEAPFPGRVLAASAKTGVPIGYLSLGPRIPDDLARPGLDGLVDSVLRPREGLAA
jgi:flagellar biosynthesis GTPase FlhF